MQSNIKSKCRVENIIQNNGSIAHQNTFTIRTTMIRPILEKETKIQLILQNLHKNTKRIDKVKY